MANDEAVDLLRKGAAIWNSYRRERSHVDLREANLRGVDLSGASLRESYLRSARMFRGEVSEADFHGADFPADFADLHRHLISGAKITFRADLSGADLSGADLSGADLTSAILIETNLTDADLTGCRVYGISAWDLKLEGATQRDLVITRLDQPEITVDNLEVAQFIYLLLNNKKIRDVIDTIGKRGVLLLGRFSEGRIAVLERLREGASQAGLPSDSVHLR